MDFSWFSVRKGRITTIGKPGEKALKRFSENGVTHLWTLLSEREGAQSLGENARQSNLQWIWLPLPNGNPPQDSRTAEIRGVYTLVAEQLDQGASVVVHCAAGIHRTGMITYGFLRFLGLSASEGRDALLCMREHTAKGVGDHRLQWGEWFAGNIQG